MKTDRKPNLFIVGAAKSGTYSMHRILNQHPQIYMSAIKEPVFFNKFERFDQIQEEDIQEYIRGFFSHVKDELYIGESSVDYLISPNCAEIIHEFNPDAKIIIILRNPVQRAISGYKMMLRDRRTTKSFDEALQEKDILTRKGLYYQDVKRYIDTFGRDAVKIYIFEEMVRGMDSVFKDLCTFLGVSDFSFDCSKKYNIKGKIDNSVYAKLYVAYTEFLKKSPRANRLLKRLFSQQRLWRFNKKLRYRLLEKHIIPEDPSEISISQDSKDTLKKYYLEDIERLESLLDVDLSLWK